jgi:hypothetical protein
MQLAPMVHITIKLKDERKLVHCILQKWYFNLQKYITMLYCLSGYIIKWQ